MYPDGVTIAIPNWNHEVFLARAIQSAMDGVRALKSAGTEAEVLVVDDASRDGSHALLRQLEARYYADGLRVHIHPTNRGLSASRNTGLLEAQFRYVLFMDADNALIGANAPFFHRAIRDTDAAAVFGNLLVRTLGQDMSTRLLTCESFQNRIFDGNYIDAFALFDRIQVADVGGYSSTLPGWEDWELWARLSTNGRRIVFVPLAFGYYYELPNSMIRTAKNGEEIMARFKRQFNQTGFRSNLPMNTNQLRYYPEVGYL
jgi:glycosyltransferase involved in cell wall biosynthesis